MAPHTHLLWLVAACCLLSVVVARNTQTKLEDIEKDTLLNERQVKAQQQVQRTANSQQQQPQQSQIPAQPPYPYFGVRSQLPGSNGPHLFSPDARDYAPPPPLEQQFPSNLPQQQLEVQPYEQPPYAQVLNSFPHPSPSQQPFHYPVLTATTIGQDPQSQHYYTQSKGSPPKYIYNDAVPAHVPASANPQVQFIQFLDPNSAYLRSPTVYAAFKSQHKPSSHNLAGLIARTAHTYTLPRDYQEPIAQTYNPEGVLPPANVSQYRAPSRPFPPQTYNYQGLQGVVYQPQGGNTPTYSALGGLTGQAYNPQNLFPPQRFEPRKPIPAPYNPQAQIVSRPVYVTPQLQPQTNSKLRPFNYQIQNNVLAQQRYLIPGANNVNPQIPLYERELLKDQQEQRLLYRKFQNQQAQSSITNAVYEKRQPQSLLESYVPSVLQVEYYKQLQKGKQANALPKGIKYTEPVPGKDDINQSFEQNDQHRFEYQFESQ